MAKTYHLLFTSKKGWTETHAYTGEEIAEVFGPQAAASILTSGFAITGAGIWVDMEVAARAMTINLGAGK